MSARILLVTNSAYTLSGLATWLDYLVPGLQNLGWDVCFGLVSGPRHHQPKKYLECHPIANHKSIHCACSTELGRVKAVRSAIDKVEPDLVVSVNIPDAIQATAIARNQGKKVRAVMTCHGIQEDLFADMRVLSDELDAVVCTNRLACRLAVELGRLPEERVHHSAYGTRVAPQLPATPQNARFTIGYSGRLEENQKRIADVVEIADRLNADGLDFEMLIAGDGPARSKIQGAIKSKGLGNRVRLLGYVSPENLAKQLYNKIDALLVTSSWETGPIVIWEAMAAGKPVVSSKYIGSGRESILEHGNNCLLFSIGDVEEAAKQLHLLSSNADAYQSIREKAFATVTQRLSCDVSVNRWDAILSDIASTPPVAGSMNVDDIPSSPGRLTRLLGESRASSLRQLMRRLPPDSGPGGEWPHTLQGSTMSSEEFFFLAQDLDSVQAHLPTP